MTGGEAISGFIDGVRRLDPDAVVVRDSPDTPGASVWLDIRAGDALFVVEWNPRLGFGFAPGAPGEEEAFGSPSAFFVAGVDDAVNKFGQILSRRKPGYENIDRQPEIVGVSGVGRVIAKFMTAVSTLLMRVGKTFSMWIH